LEKNKADKSQNSLKGKGKMSQPIKRGYKKTLTLTRKTQMNNNLKILCLIYGKSFTERRIYCLQPKEGAHHNRADV
jgi:hypothetical protein